MTSHGGFLATFFPKADPYVSSHFCNSFSSKLHNTGGGEVGRREDFRREDFRKEHHALDQGIKNLFVWLGE